LHVSKSKLFRAFSRETGMSVMDYIAECRMKKAMDFLANTDKTVSEICAQVGYNYPAHFAKMFREKTGKSPLQFRNSFRKK
jgi:AraC-like DNA-binding protein